MTIQQNEVSPDAALLESAYQAGWVTCAAWAQRDDLCCDVGSPRYDQDRDEQLDRLRASAADTSKASEAVDLPVGWASLDSLPDQDVVLLAGLDAHGFPFMEVKNVDHEFHNADFWRARGYYAWMSLGPTPSPGDFKPWNPHEHAPASEPAETAKPWEKFDDDISEHTAPVTDANLLRQIKDAVTSTSPSPAIEGQDGPPDVFFVIRDLRKHWPDDIEIRAAATMLEELAAENFRLKLSPASPSPVGEGRDWMGLAQRALWYVEYYDDVAEELVGNRIRRMHAKLLLADLRAALAAPTPTPASAVNEWKEAVINELIVSHSLTAEHETNPRKAIQDVISWNVAIALDPLVSSDAEALIQRGRDEKPASGGGERCSQTDDGECVYRKTRRFVGDPRQSVSGPCKNDVGQNGIAAEADTAKVISGPPSPEMRELAAKAVEAKAAPVDIDEWAEKLVASVHASAANRLAQTVTDATDRMSGALRFILHDEDCKIPEEVRASAMKYLDEYCALRARESAPAQEDEAFYDRLSRTKFFLAPDDVELAYDGGIGFSDGKSQKDSAQLVRIAAAPRAGE